LVDRTLAICDEKCEVQIISRQKMSKDATHPPHPTQLIPQNLRVNCQSHIFA